MIYNHVLINAGFKYEDFDEMSEEEYEFHFALEMSLKNKNKQSIFGGI